MGGSNEQNEFQKSTDLIKSLINKSARVIHFK